MTADPATPYDRATRHYLSAARRDPVKRLWEEPFSRAVLARALRALGPEPATPVRVLDVGAGVGDGFFLLEDAVGQGAPDLAGLSLSYVGLDVDAGMVQAARHQFRGRTGVEFLEADIRRELPDEPFDLYMSAGVPYSHLTPAELDDFLVDLFTAIRTHRRRAAVVLDVLGRYSLEWVPNWASSEWDYDMSFFSDTDDAEAITARMTFHSRASLWGAVTDAADRAGATVTGIEFSDRSVAVGRHTATGAFNPGLRPYRLLLNRLLDGDVDVNPADLVLDPPTRDAPPEIGGFFASFAGAWNAHVADTAAVERVHGATSHGRQGLAERLRRVEHGVQRGLGTGHSLMAVAVVDGTR